MNAVKTTRQARELEDPSERLFRAAWTGGAFQDLGGTERFAREIIAGDTNSNGLRWASLFLSLSALRLFGETEQYYMDRISRGDTSLRARVGIAAVHALRGDREAAYDWLQQAIDAGFYQYAELERHPCFESLHGEERFQEMMAGVKVRVEEMRREVDAIEAEGS